MWLGITVRIAYGEAKWNILGADRISGPVRSGLISDPVRSGKKIGRNRITSSEIFNLDFVALEGRS
jgi:hypothetical protein